MNKNPPVLPIDNPSRYRRTRKTQKTPLGSNTTNTRANTPTLNSNLKHSPPSRNQFHGPNNDSEDSIRILYQNARGLKTKTHKIFQNILSEDFDFIAITESWLSPDIHSNELIDSRYNVFRLDRDPIKSKKKRGGGLLFAAKTQYLITRVSQWDSSDQKYSKMWLRISYRGDCFYLCLVYLIPPVRKLTVENFVNSLLDISELQGKKLMVLGDINIRDFVTLHEQDSSDKRIVSLNRLMSFYNLNYKNLIKNSQKKILDQCFDNFDSHFTSNLRKKTSFIEITRGNPLVKEDKLHPALEIKLGYRRVKLNNIDENLAPKFNFKKANIVNIKNHLDNMSWNFLEHLDDPNEILDQIYSKLNEAFIAHIPLMPKSRSSKFPIWWSKETKTMFNSKERLRKIKNKTHKQSCQYSEMRRKVKKEIKNDYTTYVKNSVEQLKKDSKFFWKFIKQKKEPGKLKQYKYQDKIISDPSEVAHAYSEHLKKSFSSAPSSYNTSDLPSSNNNFYFHLPQIKESDILAQIKQMDHKKPAGPDGIAPSIIKSLPQSFIKPLHILYNCSLAKSTFPDKLKEAAVTPVPKKNSDKIEDQRPISNLNIFAKIFEGIIYEYMSVFVFNHVSTHQHGFVRARSTVSNLMEFSEFISDHINKGQIDVLYTDVEKGFDRLNHDAILKKMNSLGFSKQSLNLFSSYLKNRKLNIGDTSIIPNSGIAQGSKISSLMFIMAYDDIKHHIKYSQYSLYADDFKIYRVIKTHEDCTLLQRDIDSVSSWLSKVGLNFHPQKCKKLTFTTKNKPIISTYTINNQPVESANSFKDLGVQFQTNFSFIPHINNITSSAYRNLGMIIRYCKEIDDIDAIRTLYLSLVRSKVEYASIIWSPEQKCHAKTIESIQAKFTRYLFKKINGFYPKFPQNIPYKQLIQQLDLPTLENRRNQDRIKFLHKILNHTIDSPQILERVPFQIPPPGLRPRNNLFKVRNKLSPLSAAMKLYNDLEMKPDFSLNKTKFAEFLESILISD